MDRNKGNTLILAVLMTVLVGGLVAALVTTTFSFARTSNEMLNRELAYRAAESGGAYYLLQVMTHPGYFDANPAPHKAQPMGSASFQLESVQKLNSDQWQLLLRGSCDAVDFPINTVIGHGSIRIPDGIVVVGTGKPADVVLTIKGGSKVGSFDPDDAPYNPANPGSEGSIGANGSISITGSSTVNGNATALGTVTVAATSLVTGNTVQNGPPLPITGIDPIVQAALLTSKTTNNNAVLAGIFGPQWKPVPGAENYGDLILTTPGTYVVPSGIFRFRRFEAHKGVNVIFSTSTGPSKLIYVGAGTGTGTLNNLILDSGATVRIDPGSTKNGLLTVLGPDCDFFASGGSVFGQAIGDPANSGYSQIISLGGDASVDDISVTGGSSVYGRLYAAAHVLTINGGSTWYGSALARTVNIGGTTPGTFAVDVGTLGNALIDPSTYAILARWPAAS